MNVINKKAWKLYKETNQDIYSKTVILFAEKWANLMEKQIKQGKEIKDIAKITSEEAGNLKGFTYSCAIKVLFDIWKYGKELRDWHISNLK